MNPDTRLEALQAALCVIGIFLLLAARDPLANRSLIQFAIWSSIVHGGIMAVRAGHDHAERANLIGDVPALFAVAALLWFLLPARTANDR